MQARNGCNTGLAGAVLFPDALVPVCMVSKKPELWMRPQCMSMISPLVSFERTLFRRRRRAMLLGAAGLVVVSTAANADCTQTSGGTTVTCTGASTGYSNLSSGISLSADSTSTVTGPILLGNSAQVTNGGSMTSSTTAPILQVGTDSSIVNNGTISLTGGSSGSAAVLMGDNGTFTNNGTLSSVAGSTAIQFGQNGTFINDGAATAVVTGNIDFGPNLAGGTSRFVNYGTFGLDGNVYSSGNTSLYNDAPFDGSFVQTPTGGTVDMLNDAGGNFTGGISTGDTTSLDNRGTMTITAASSIGSAKLGVSSFTNEGALTLGTSTSPTELVVNGAFTNSASGVVNIGLHSNGASAPVAGSSYSQIYAAGPAGTAMLGGTLNLVPASGFYPTGSTYAVVLADQSISGNFAQVNGNALPFISFVPIGIVTIGTQQAYEVEAERTSTYADVISSVATPSEIAIARALQPLVDTANADATSTAATLVGDIDLLTIPQTLTLLDQIDPSAYLRASQMLNDQVNLFSRQVMLRTLDPRYADSQSGWWLDMQDQFHVGSSGTTTDVFHEGIWGLSGGYDISSGHFTAGGAFGYSEGSVHNGSKSFAGKNESYMLGAYGAFHAGPITAAAQLDYDMGHMSTSKDLPLVYTTTTTAATSTTAATTTTTPTNTVVTANPGDRLFKATATIGVDLVAAGLKATPFGGIDYSRGSINGFTEDNGEAADLTVAQININRTDALAGIDLTATGGDFRPYVRAIYRSQIGGATAPAISAYFDGNTAAGFTLDGTPFRHEADIDAGLDIVDDVDRMSIFVGYQGTIRKQMSDHGVMGGVRIQL